MKNNFISKMVEKSMIRELEEDVKVEIKGFQRIENNKHFKSTKTKKLTSQKIIDIANVIVQKAFKNEIKFVSSKLYKACIDKDYEKIKKIETNVNITLNLMKKDKVEIASYKAPNNKTIFKKYDYKNQYKGYIFKAPKKLDFIRYFMDKATKSKIYKIVKMISYKDILKPAKRGFEILDNIELEDLKSNACLLLLEYAKKYNNEIINNKGFIPYTIFNKITYKIQYLMQKVKSYNNTKIFLNDSNKIEYLIDKKSFEIYQSPIGETLQKAKQIEKRRDNAIDYILQTLTKQQFEIYQLKLSGYSFQDIALKLDKTRGTISKIYYRVVSYMQKDAKLAAIMQSL